MASMATSTYLPPLDAPHEREGIGRELELVLHALALGFVPDGQVQAVAAGSQLNSVAQGAIEDSVVVRELTRRIADVSERVRARLQYVGAVDLVSQDVLIEVVRELEKQQWLLRIQLEERA